MTRDKIKLGPVQKKSLYGILSLLWLSGVLWLLFEYGLKPTDSFSLSALKAGCLKLHGAAAMAFLVALGALLPVHVKLAWQRKRNRIAGVWLLGINAFLIATGWLLYYAGSDTLRPWISTLHGAIGLGLPLFVYLHIRWARRTPPGPQDAA